jgi:hypothetical protein
LEQASNGSHIVRIQPAQLHASDILTLPIRGIGKLKNDAVTLFTAKSPHFKQTQDEKTQGHYVGTPLFYPAFVFERALSTL